MGFRFQVSGVVGWKSVGRRSVDRKFGVRSWEFGVNTFGVNNNVGEGLASSRNRSILCKLVNYFRRVSLSGNLELKSRLMF